MANSKRTVVYAATPNQYPTLVACANSAALNGNIDETILLIENDYFPFEVLGNIRTINVANQPWIDKTTPNAKMRWTYMSMMRCALAHLLPDYERVLWLDTDTIVEHDISALWDFDFTGYYYAGVPQPKDSNNGRIYINAGVLLCNLVELRDGKEDKIIEALNNKWYGFPDQDCTNELCEGRILPLEGRYNISRFTKPDTETYIRHYAAQGLPMQEYVKYTRGVNNGKL